MSIYSMCKDRYVHTVHAGVLYVKVHTDVCMYM